MAMPGYGKWVVAKTVAQLIELLGNYPPDTPLAGTHEHEGEYYSRITLERVQVLRVVDGKRRDGYCDTDADYRRAWVGDEEAHEVFDALLIE